MQFDKTFAKDIAMHPDPLPTSSICNAISIFEKYLRAVSTRISVSGLGINTSLVNLNSKPINAVLAKIYCSGSPFALLFKTETKKSDWCLFKYLSWFK
jgi:hypothetical protein